MRRLPILALCLFLFRLEAQEVAPSDEFGAAMEAFDSKVAELRAETENTSWESLDAQGVQLKLARIVDLDQYIRQLFIQDYESQREVIGERMVEIDRANTLELRRLLAARGWPVISVYGREADQNAFLLVQHADQDPDFQRKILSLLNQLVDEGESNPANFAYLYDRVAKADGRPQRYGTQFQCVSTDELGPRELEDQDNIDTLRASVGLPPLDEYIRLATEALGVDFIKAQCASFLTSE